jgi:hypothetical protein
MKSSFLLAGFLALLTIGSHPLKAQTESGGGMRGGRMLSFLSAEDKAKFLAARQKAMADNPDLKAEGESLMKEGKAVHDGTATPEDKQALLEKFMAYQQKLHDAMLKEDPTLQPIFDQIKQHMGQMMAKKEAASSGTTAPASTPPAQ